MHGGWLRRELISSGKDGRERREKESFIKQHVIFQKAVFCLSFLFVNVQQMSLDCRHYSFQNIPLCASNI